MSFWKRRIKNISEISKETGIDEQKIKELKEGKREITGEAMNKVLDAINKIEKKTDIEKKVEKEEIFRWYESVDLNKLMHEFGYNRQKDCAEEIGIAQSSLCELINRKPKKYTRVIQKVYDFFNDEFNKNINKKTKRAYHKKIQKSNDKLKYLRDLELNNIMIQLECKTHEQLANKIGISRRTLESIFNGTIKSDSKLVNKAYTFIKKYLDNKPIVKEAENNQISNNIVEPSKTSSNEENNKESINVLDNTEPSENEPKKAELEDIQEKDIWKELYKMQVVRTEKLQKQIERYEKLIDRLD